MEERLPEAIEMRMLRWICGISLCEHHTNEDIRQCAKIASISVKAREARLRWLRHVMRIGGGNILNRVYCGEFQAAHMLIFTCFSYTFINLVIYLDI